MDIKMAFWLFPQVLLMILSIVGFIALVLYIRKSSNKDSIKLGGSKRDTASKEPESKE